MPREKPHYQETLVDIRARAAELYPGELLFGSTKVAKILGKSRGWVWQHAGNCTLPHPGVCMTRWTGWNAAMKITRVQNSCICLP